LWDWCLISFWSWRWKGPWVGVFELLYQEQHLCPPMLRSIYGLLCVLLSFRVMVWTTTFCSVISPFSAILGECESGARLFCFRCPYDCLFRIIASPDVVSYCHEQNCLDQCLSSMKSCGLGNFHFGQISFQILSMCLWLIDYLLFKQELIFSLSSLSDIWE
jgi:hypothetical protein